jgi:nucleoside-diphosphate-sugar epimerase
VTDSSIVGVVGATSLVGGCILQLLLAQERSVVAFSRRKRSANGASSIIWREVQAFPPASPEEDVLICDWIYLAPIWTLSEHYLMLQAFGVRRIVAISSTSRFTKHSAGGAHDPAENFVAQRLAEGEGGLRAWAGSKGIEWIILRPTLIYGFGQDKNLSEIARFIRRFRFFPVLGSAHGLRQPIHAEDVAQACCLSVLECPSITNRAYNIGGGETLEYRDMVARVFEALNLPKRLVKVPLFAFKLAVLILRNLPKYRHLSASMATRMNRDLVFDCEEAKRDFGFSPKRFLLTKVDLPV